MDTRLEKSIFFALLLIATVGMTQFLAVHFFTGAGDSASMIDLIRNVAAGHGLRSSFNSANDIWTLLASNADAYCRLTFIPRFRGASVLTWHPYWAAYPMAALTALPGVNALTVTTFLTALSHIGVLGLLWWFLRRQNVPMAVAAMFVLAVFVFKPVSESLLGQLYFDRLFLLPGTALVLLVHLHLTEKARSLWLIAALAFFCVLVSERPAIMVGVFLLGYPLLRQGRTVVRSPDSLMLMAMGLACLVYVYIYLKFVQQSPYASSWMSPAALREGLQTSLAFDGALHAQTMKLFAVLAPFILLGLFDWRLALTAAGSVTPNLMISVGGAEKYVFVTHYHMPYLPFVVAAATVGLARLWRLALDRAGGAQSQRMLPVTAAVTAMLALVAAYSNWFNETDLTHTFVFNRPMDPILPLALVPDLPNPNHSYDFVLRDFSRTLVLAIPRGSAVSAPEGLWPALIDRKNLTLDFMPYGIGPDPYVVLPYALQPIGAPELELSVFQPGADISKIRGCVQTRVDQSYRQIRQADFGGQRYIIYQHK